MKVKILVAYHKPDLLIKNSFLEPIHVGRAILREKTEAGSVKKLNLLQSEMIGDDTGENISGKNLSYNEMTALYWAWKNYEALGDPDYIGLMHYRRHFCIKKMNERSAYFETNQVDNMDTYLEKELGLTESAVCSLLSKNDFIVTKPYYKKSVYDHYKESHKIEELDHAISIVKRYFPKYYRACKKYINGHLVYFCNMFVLPKDLFFEYCSFVFGVLQKYEDEVDITGKRLFISERLTGVFIQYLLDKGLKAAYIPTMYLEENVKIPVAFATDINFVPPTFVAIASLLENAKPTTFYDITIMVSGGIAEIVKEQSRGFDKRYKNYNINVVDMGNQFSDVKMSIKHITSPTYYRLLLPKLLSNYNKCLYLDSDIVVNGDLTEFYRTNIDEYYIAGVRAAGYYYPEHWVQKHTQEVGLPSIDQYINAGILLFNLSRIRNEKIDEKMLSLVNRGFSSQDQDIINLACYNNIKILPLKYNLMTKYLRYENGEIVLSEQDKKIYGVAESEEALLSPVIIHYADKIKPWADSSVIFFKEWQRYAKLSPLYKEREKSRVSVIIPIFNMEKYLASCLDSVLSQTLQEIEVICVNDGSQDNSLKILYEYQKKYSNLYIINQKNQGVAVARNAGLDFANAEFVCFMDPDDFYPSNDVLEFLYQKAVKNRAEICGGSWMELHEHEDSVVRKTAFEGILAGYTFKTEGKMKYADYQFDYGFQRFIFSLALIRKHNFKFPLYTRYQDPPFFVKCMVVANTFYAVTKYTYCYRWGYQQSTIYRGKKILDWTLGIIDELRISSRNQLSKLHRYVFDRINKQMANTLYERVIAGQEPYLFKLLVRANTAVDRKLLRREIPTVNDNTILEPLRRSLNYFMNCANEKRILPKKQTRNESLFVSVVKWIPRKTRAFFRYWKNFGFKCTMVRLFCGRAKAQSYKVKCKRG